MGTNDRREKVRNIRREDIINAAEQVFFAKGYHNATMDDVAKEAEYSKRTIYAYFNSKEQVYDAIIARAYQILNRQYEQAFNTNSPANGLEKVILMGQVYIDFLYQYPKYFEAMIYYENRDEDLSSRDEFKLANYREGNVSADRLIACIKAGIADGSICEELDPVSTAFTLYANIIGIGNIIQKKEKYIQQTYSRSTTELIETMFKLVTAALKS